MSAFTAGESTLNRVWSVSADGHVDEVNQYVGRALKLFKQVRAAPETARTAAASTA